jgi:hypothetical protein
MRLAPNFARLCLPAVLLAAAPVAAQAVQAAGFATISIAGLGNTTTIAGDSRLPILVRDVSHDAASNQLRLRATGRRGAVRQLDIEVNAPRAGQRYEFGSSGGASLRVRMEQGEELTADAGRGFVTITSFDPQRVTGTYEGTFSRGQVPVVIRGRFEASLPRSVPVATPPAAPR